MELGLGTAQFGFDYGISNEDGKVPAGKVRTLLEIAYTNGIRVLDTAAAYGDSEQALGQAMPEDCSFRVVTKLPPVKKDCISEEDVSCLRETFFDSLKKLRINNAAGLILHRPRELILSGGEKIYSLLQSLKEERLIEKIGISVYDGEEIDRLFSYYDFDLIQLPLNVLDQRLVKSGHIEKLKKRGVEIHARSVFLQGLLLMPLEQIDPYFNPIITVLKKYRAFLDEHGLSPVEGALGFLRRLDGPDVLLVGVTNEKQLRDNIAAFKSAEALNQDYSRFAVEEKEMVNPQLWELRQKASTFAKATADREKAQSSPLSRLRERGRG